MSCPGATSIGGVTVLRDGYLSQNMMVVSSDIYELLTQTPEERRAKAQLLRDRCDELLKLTEKLLKREPL